MTKKSKKKQSEYQKDKKANIISKVILGGLVTALASSICYFSISSPLVKQNSKFDAHENTKHLIEYKTVNIKGIPGVMASYDLDGNGEEDTNAFFISRSYINNDNYTDQYAKIVLVDKDNDGKLEYMLMDTDDNFTLDEKVTPRDLKKMYEPKNEGDKS